jgi:uncharacterized protein YcbK (DUF882 family)
MTYPKGSRDKVGKHFVAREFDCACSNCSYTFIDPGLVARLDRLRDLLGARVVITSGYRCDWYQANLKERGHETSKGRSTHQDGRAADIRSDERSGSDLAVFAAEAGFTSIGVARSWIHVDMRDGLRRWGYAR